MKVTTTVIDDIETIKIECNASELHLLNCDPKCENCGHELEPDANYCGHCGHKIHY